MPSVMRGNIARKKMPLSGRMLTDKGPRGAFGFDFLKGCGCKCAGCGTSGCQTAALLSDEAEGELEDYEAKEARVRTADEKGGRGQLSFERGAVTTWPRTDIPFREAA